MNLCLSLTGLYITFIISTRDEVIRISPLCGTFGAMLHYFFLTTFFLMAADAALIYKKLVWVFKQDIPSYVAITGSIAWSKSAMLKAMSPLHMCIYSHSNPSTGVVNFTAAAIYYIVYLTLLLYNINSVSSLSTCMHNEQYSC